MLISQVLLEQLKESTYLSKTVGMPPDLVLLSAVGHGGIIYLILNVVSYVTATCTCKMYSIVLESPLKC